MNHIINFKSIIFEKNFRFCYQNNNLEITNYESIPLFNFEEIDIKYNDGKTDNLFASPRTNYIGRFLNSKGSSGDPGYRIGKNQMIWDYVLN